MSFLRNVLHDLVQKKLWPIAIVLVVALVAVPIVLGGSDSSSTSAAGAAATPTGADGLSDQRAVAGAQVVSLEDQAAGKVDRAGKTRDPFIQHHLHTTTVAAAPSSTTPATTGGGSSGSGSGSGSGETQTTPSTTTTTPKTTTPKTDSTSTDTYHVKLKFGEDGAMKTYDNVARLTPFPSSTNPYFVFLGLKSDGKTAVFLVSSDAVPTAGGGTCTPTPENCEQIAMKAGDLEFFSLQTGTAGVVQYQLEMVSISRTKAATKASAARAHTRESQAGREYIRQVVADDPAALDGWDYSSQLGLLVAKAPATKVADAPAKTTDPASSTEPASTTTPGG